MMNREEIKQLITKKELEETLKGELELTASERVDRYLAVKPHEITPNTHFAAISAECVLLFRDGHYYGCVSLVQSVTEALVRFICEKNSMRASSDFEDNIETLHRRKLIDDALKSRLLEIWKKRNDYHHLNPKVELDRQALEDLAKKKAQLLIQVEREIFAFTVLDGKLRPRHPKYWEIADNQTEVYVNFE